MGRATLLSDADIDLLLDGRSVDGAEQLEEFIRACRLQFIETVPTDIEERHVKAAVELARELNGPPAGAVFKRTRPKSPLRPSLIPCLVAAFLAVLVFVGLAAGGHLPDPMQAVVARLIRPFGIEVESPKNAKPNGPNSPDAPVNRSGIVKTSGADKRRAAVVDSHSTEATTKVIHNDRRQHQRLAGIDDKRANRARATNKNPPGKESAKPDEPPGKVKARGEPADPPGKAHGHARNPIKPDKAKKTKAPEPTKGSKKAKKSLKRKSEPADTKATPKPKKDSKEEDKPPKP
jgi:hypothetical protein